MNNSEPLAWYGAAFLIVMGWMLVVPYLRGKSDLLTAWNLFLLGSAIFIGLGCIEVVLVPLHWKQLQWFQPTHWEVLWYIMATTAFYVTLIVSYYYNPLARAISARCLNNWPPDTAPVTLFVLIACLFTVIAYLILAESTFLGPLLFNLSHKAAVFACVFSFLLWYRNRLNVAWLLLFLAVLLAAGLFSMLVFAGRRLLLSVLFGPVLCIYWLHVRHWRPTRAVAFLAAAASVIFVSMLIYSSFRWFSVGRDATERTATNVVQQLKKQVGQRNWIESFASNKLHYFAQYTAHYALLTERYVANGQLTPKPFNSLVFMAAYPIPRRLWPEKPVVVGVFMVHEIVGERGTSWGLSIAGHGAYEGGIFALVIYAVLVSIGIRLFDDPLKRQPTNPFLISILAAGGPHILTWSRGDIAIMSNECMECFLFAIILGIAGRILFGTARRVRPTLSYAPGARLMVDVSTGSGATR